MEVIAREYDVVVIDTAADMADLFGELGDADPLGFGFGPPGPASAGGERARPCGKHRRKAASRTKPAQPVASITG